MPNWIEGTMKLRGKREDIKRFIDEGIDTCMYWLNQKRPDKDSVVTDECGDDYLSYVFKDEMYVKDTSRAFIQPHQEIYFDYPEGIVVLRVVQAWSFKTEQWEDISKKYNLDLRLFGVEKGMQFCQEIIIIRGEATVDRAIEYDDWMWECPFPNLGG